MAKFSLSNIFLGLKDRSQNLKRRRDGNFPDPPMRIKKSTEILAITIKKFIYTTARARTSSPTLNCTFSIITQFTLSPGPLLNCVKHVHFRYFQSATVIPMLWKLAASRWDFCRPTIVTFMTN